MQNPASFCPLFSPLLPSSFPSFLLSSFFLPLFFLSSRPPFLPSLLFSLLFSLLSFLYPFLLFSQSSLPSFLLSFLPLFLPYFRHCLPFHSFLMICLPNASMHNIYNYSVICSFVSLSDSLFIWSIDHLPSFVHLFVSIFIICCLFAICLTMLSSQSFFIFSSFAVVVWTGHSDRRLLVVRSLFDH